MGSLIEPVSPDLWNFAAVVGKITVGLRQPTTTVPGLRTPGHSMKVGTWYPLPLRILLSPEESGTTVRPRVDHGAVVGGVHDYFFGALPPGNCPIFFWKSMNPGKRSDQLISG